jgi:hypothetical protein
MHQQDIGGFGHLQKLSSADKRSRKRAVTSKEKKKIGA